MVATVGIVFVRHDGEIRSIETSRPLRHRAHPCNTLAFRRTSGRREMGEIVLAGGLKGGTGKSTTAANLVGLLLKEGKTVLGVDADDSENLNKWSGLRARTRKTPPKWLDPDTVAYASVVVKRGEGLI